MEAHTIYSLLLVSKHTIPLLHMKICGSSHCPHSNGRKSILGMVVDMVSRDSITQRAILTSSGHTCHVVGENLIIVGGMETTSTGGNVNNCTVSQPSSQMSAWKPRKLIWYHPLASYACRDVQLSLVELYWHLRCRRRQQTGPCTS